ncbi:hypothetical protein [Comamonas sp.]|uniref:hypothetical protein n=1 Tax=Comamonas sp. TaxID=34028 RepID=UPI00289A291D|nr:hypothetical protein [Comamonas sp.]
MTVSFSTGYRNAAAGAALNALPAEHIMSGCVIMIYAGSIPASADAALESATLLATYSLNGTGDALGWSAPANGSVSKVPGENWSGIAVASGTPSFFRYQAPDDDGALSNTRIRMQGKVGLVSDPSADLALSTMAITNGATQTIDAASATVPASM